MAKRPFLLLDFMIALSLLSMIVAFLFSSYKHLSLTKTILQKERQDIVSLQKLKLRLGQVFSHLNTLETKQPQSCHLSYDNGTDPDIQFCGLLKGHLHIDTKHRLVLVSTSKQGPQRQEILSEKIQSFELKFFNRQKGAWESKYPSEKPFMMQMILNQAITLPFFL